MEYHLIPVRMILKRKEITNSRVSGVKGTLMHCWWECKFVQLLHIQKATVSYGKQYGDFSKNQE